MREGRSRRPGGHGNREAGRETLDETKGNVPARQSGHGIP